MKNIKFFLFLIFSFSINFCTTEPDNDYSDYKIRIDKISFSDTISVTDSLFIKFDGLVGTDGCHKFKYFETYNKLKEIHFTVWGTRPNFRTACPTVMVYLNGKEYKTKFYQTGIYKIFIHQPDNSFFMDSVFVQ
jgi:hypothetical protein